MVFGLTGQPYKTNGDIVENDEIRYDEIEIEGVTNRDEFYEYLCSYFSEEIATELITTKVENNYLFKDIDGKIHCHGGYVGFYEKQNNENWVFTDFQLPYTVSLEK